MGRPTRKGGGKSSDGKGNVSPKQGKGKGSPPSGVPNPHGFTEQGELKKSEVQLGDQSRDVILLLIARLMEARGDAVPAGHKKKKGKRGGGACADDVENALDGDFDASEEQADHAVDHVAAEADVASGVDDDACCSPEKTVHMELPESSDDETRASASRLQEKEARKEEERVKRRLMRKLLHEDRKSAKESVEVQSRGTHDAKKQPPQGNTVRLLLWNEEKRHEKPRGPTTFPRGGAEAVEEVIKTAKAKLTIKGAGKKVFWGYVHGGPNGEDKQNKNPVPLTSTLDLADGDVIIVSSRPVPQAPPKPGQPEPSPEVREVEEQGATRDARAPVSEGHASPLDAVRAAYRSRVGGRSSRKQQRGPEEVEAESAALLVDARTFGAEVRFEQRRQVRAALPAAKVRDPFLRALESAQVVVVSGETGSGKTTQLPHFILEDAVGRGVGGECSIICTQPRRLAAIGVAERVAFERGEEPGGVVGYAVRLDSRSSARTRLLFCTTGVLLQQLNEDPGLSHATHIVVDEAHERNLQTDFLLTILRDLLPRRPTLKLVLMSATLEHGLFVDYFSRGTIAARQVPLIHIPGRTHPVQTRYLDDVESAIKRRPLTVQRGLPADDDGDRDGCQPGNGHASVDEDLQAWMRANHGVDVASNGALNDRLQDKASPVADQGPDYRRIADLVAEILRGGLGPQGPGVQDSGAILVFLPGHLEIERALSQLRSHTGVNEQNAWLVPLHGQMPTHRQRLVFKPAPSPGQRKIVLATNIAETSITIDDVTHVVDTGLVKESRYDPHSRMGVLATCFVSRAAAMQRAGRAGRVRPGVCWRLFSKGFFEKLPKHTLCEMRRTALEELVLQLRLLELGNDPGEFLLRAPEPPEPASLQAALRTLVQIGALGARADGLPLTPLGFHLAHMPMDVRTAKMLLYGALLRCLSPVLTIAACLSEKSPFARGFGGKEREDSLRHEKNSAFGSLRSDHLAAVRVFEDWRKARAHGREEERSLCDKFGLSWSTLESMASLRTRFLQHLQDVGFVPQHFSADGPADGLKARRRGSGGSLDVAQPDDNPSEADWDPDANAHELALIRCALCAGLYPNVAQIQRVSGGKGGTKTFLVSAGDLDKCMVHPGSLNSRSLGEMQANHGWLLYHTKVKTSQVFLHDSTLIGSIPLLLFGGGDLRLARDRRTITLDSNMQFDGRCEETAVLMKLLRKEVDRLLLAKIANPMADLSRMAEPLLKAVAQLLQLEGARAGGLRT